jgi:CheY-like chemotaxis protein
MTKTIAVVDDNPDMLQLISLILGSKGYQVICADSGRELFKRLDEEHPDLIILDVMMPDMDGYEILTRLKTNPETEPIPVVMLTVKADYKDIEGAYKLGADYYVTKPFTSQQLLNSVELLLR